MMQSAVFLFAHIRFDESARVAAAALSIDLRRPPTRALDRAVTAHQTRFE